jgi:hypothetical protein
MCGYLYFALITDMFYVLHVLHRVRAQPPVRRLQQCLPPQPQPLDLRPALDPPGPGRFFFGSEAWALVVGGTGPGPAENRKGWALDPPPHPRATCACAHGSAWLYNMGYGSVCSTVHLRGAYGSLF